MKEAVKNRFTFAVLKGANKRQISQAVRDAFNVPVVSVKTIIVKGEHKMHQRGRSQSAIKVSDYKKAIVELPAGTKLDIFDVKDA